jgi:hypothetical protein
MMGRRRNYGFERRRKQEIKRAKQEVKRQRKVERVESGEVGPEIGEAQVPVAPEGVWEWFSPSRSRTVTSPVGERPPGEVPDDWVLLTEVEAEETEETPGSDG